MSTVLEVSEGIPQDGQIFELPLQSQDTGEPRYVTILGSFIEPTTAQERDWTRWGGIELNNPCLNYVKNFLRKGRITPVLKDRHNWVSVDYWEKATARDASYFPRQVPANYVAPLNEYGNPSKIPPLMGKMAFPGDQMEQIVNGPANISERLRRGIVELKTLKGQAYTPEPLGNGIVHDRAIWQMQTTIFPNWPNMPVLYDETERILDAASVHTYLRPIVDEMMRSLQQTRDYARATVEQTHYMMRETGAKSPTGNIPKYVELDFVLLEQLGMARQDISIRQHQAAPAPAPAMDTDLRDALKQLIGAMLEEKKANLEREKRVAELESVPTLDVNTMAAAPIAPEAPIEPEAVPQAPEPVTCECGKSFPTEAGLTLHKVRWCELNKPADIEPTQE